MPQISDYHRREVPDWLYMAYTEGEDVTIVNKEVVEWSAGKFWGTWEQGDWTGGEFMQGSFLSGDLMDVTWHDGFWKSDGTWYNVLAKDGHFSNNTSIKNSILEGGEYQSISLMDQTIVRSGPSNDQLLANKAFSVGKSTPAAGGGSGPVLTKIVQCDIAQNCDITSAIWLDGYALDCKFVSTEWWNGTINDCKFTECVWYGGEVDPDGSTSEFTSVNWKDGIWQGKEFTLGVWHNGTMLDGEMTHSLWKNGTVDSTSAIIKNITWETGDVKNIKEMINTRWKSGTWSASGKFYGKIKQPSDVPGLGYDNKAVWETGEWSNGTFGGGEKTKTGTSSWLLDEEYINKVPAELEKDRDTKSPSIWKDGVFKGSGSKFTEALWCNGVVGDTSDRGKAPTFSKSVWLDGTVNFGKFNDCAWVEGTFGLGSTKSRMTGGIWLGGISDNAILSGVNFTGGKVGDRSVFSGTFHAGQFSQSAKWGGGDFRGTAFHKGVIVQAPDTPYNID